MATLGDMKRRIGRELDGNKGAIAQISEAIDSAIAFYERRRFFFNEGRSLANTTQDQIEYLLPSDIIEADHLQLTVNGTQFKLERVAYEFFVERDQSTPVTGQPYWWAIQAQALFLWPVPDSNSYQLTLSYLKKLTPIANGESSGWTTIAERLIRARVKWDLALGVMKDPIAAQGYKAMETEEFMNLQRETNQLNSSGRIRAHY